MGSYNLNDDQKELLRKVVRCEQEAKLPEKGFLELFSGDDAYTIQGCGIRLASRHDLEALCDEGLLIREQGATHFRYRITNAARRAVESNFELPPSILPSTVVNTGGGAYVGGDVKVGRDFVGRDQSFTRMSAQGAELESLIQLLTELRAGLAQADLDGDVQEVIENDINVVEKEAAEAQPKLNVIEAKLRGIGSIIKGATGIGVAAQALVGIVQKAIETAHQLFA